MKLTWAAPSVLRFLRYGKKASEAGCVAAGLFAATSVHEAFGAKHVLERESSK